MNNNPFMTQDLTIAAVQARVHYVNTLVQRQKNGGTSLHQLESEQKRRERSLDLYRGEAWRAAALGDIGTAVVQLRAIILEWGVYRALDELIAAGGVYLDPHDVDAAKIFIQDIDQNVVFWTTELNNIWNEEQQRQQNDLARQLRTDYQHLIDQQSSSLKQAHFYNQEYAGSLHELMQDAHLLYGEVQSSIKESTRAQQVMTETAKQNLPREREDAHYRTQTFGCLKGCLSRGCLAVAFLLAIPAAIGLAYLILTHVVLH